MTDQNTFLEIANEQVIGQVRRDIAANFKTFTKLVDLVETMIAEGRYETAAACAQVAADFAWKHHPGLFVSSRLEHLLITIGARASVKEEKQHLKERPLDTVDGRARVLHVLTQAYDIGGHTRLVWNWIRNDSVHQHSVVLTDQRDITVPECLRKAVEESHGQLYFLDRPVISRLAKAVCLEKLAESAEIVVLHIHPYDAIPSIAFSKKKDNPKLLFLNHADHVFWMGTEISDMLINFRDSGSSLSIARRGVPEENCMTLPIPIDTPSRDYSRNQAKTLLGIPQEKVVCLTVASEFKYETAKNSVNFLDAVLPIFNQNKNLVLIAIGPKQIGRWAEEFRRSNGQIKAMGTQANIALFYQAADIYLDSFPFSSITSALGAGSYATPILGMCLHPPDAAVLYAESPGLDRCMLTATNLSSYRKKLVELVDNSAYRTQLGEDTRNQIALNNCAPMWGELLGNCYKTLRSHSPARDHANIEIAGKYNPIDLSLAIMNSTNSRKESPFINYHLESLPRFEKLRAWVRCMRSLPTFTPKFFLAEFSMLIFTVRQMVTMSQALNKIKVLQKNVSSRSQ